MKRAICHWVFLYGKNAIPASKPQAKRQAPTTGEEINVFFDINAREYQGRWYNDIRAWRVDRVTPGEVPAPGVMPGAQAFAGQPAGVAPAAAPMGTAPMAAPAQPAATQAPVDFTEGDNTDDLPF